ncbi:uncharacterized protein MONBRDRAFT_34615 [Monosiga brevicollis MX1]|uniref:PH domain-containing protein n=1 Tax=Monosiga brevicollis TaxID=81824 RepID=A9VCW0_MONBE|nr:uncharacterized protein MONBRDRAFT_34615 [Monosiga brevicollis MX1]EDQ84636.1 predicted protein [Monosiga brevicollis MX1]|eukprot:XP_001750540.1 hypothetical protein [Monosiga brevicollis MX1]
MVEPNPGICSLTVASLLSSASTSSLLLLGLTATRRSGQYRRTVAMSDKAEGLAAPSGGASADTTPVPAPAAATPKAPEGNHSPGSDRGIAVPKSRLAPPAFGGSAPTSLSHTLSSYDDEDGISFISALEHEMPNSPTNDSNHLKYSSSRDSRKQYKLNRSRYEEEKQRMTDMSGYDMDERPYKTGIMKIRNTLRSWTKFYCELRHGMLLLYKEDRHDVWMGTVLLAGGMVMERPSRKEGHTFKFSHPLRAAIHAPRGPKGEIWFNLVRIPSDHCMFRVSTAQECEEWITAFRRSIFGPHPKYESRMAEPVISNFDTLRADVQSDDGLCASQHDLHHAHEASPRSNRRPMQAGENGLSSATRQQLEAQGQAAALAAESDLDHGEDLIPNWRADARDFTEPAPPIEVEENAWELHLSSLQHSPGQRIQEQQFTEEEVATVFERMGKVPVTEAVTLPAFMLEPRSELERLGDAFHHADILTDAAKHAMPRGRFVSVLRWYLSSFYAKASGALRPIPPCKGEVCRLMFEHPIHGSTPSSRVFFVAEAVEHGCAALHGSSRVAGWAVDGVINCSHHFTGDKLVSIERGQMEVHLARVAETFVMTRPAQVTSGLSTGHTLTTYNGSIELRCDMSGYRFKGSFDPNNQLSNVIEGTLFHNEEKIATLHGEWDGQVHIKTLDNDMHLLLDTADEEIEARRLTRRAIVAEELWGLPAVEDQPFTDSQALWSSCAELSGEDFENYIASLRTRMLAAHAPTLFHITNGQYRYTEDVGRPWDYLRDLYDYQSEGHLKCLTIQDTVTGTPRSSTLTPVQTLRNRKRPNSLSGLASVSTMDSDVFVASPRVGKSGGGRTNLASVVEEAGSGTPQGETNASEAPAATRRTPSVTVKSSPSANAATPAGAAGKTPSAEGLAQVTKRVARLESAFMMERALLVVVLAILLGISVYF